MKLINPRICGKCPLLHNFREELVCECYIGEAPLGYINQDNEMLFYENSIDCLDKGCPNYLEQVCI